MWRAEARIASDPLGDWYVARREAHYRDAAERGVLWRHRPAAPEAPPDEYVRMRLDEDGWVARTIGGPVLQRVLDLGADPSPFFVLEWVEAVAVRRLLRDGRALSPALAVQLGAALADEAARIHDLRAPDGSELLIRDLRLGADTVWLSPDGIRVANPGLARFGIGRRALDSPDDLDFLAPETVRGESPVGETDVFTIALVVLALARGRSPLLRTSPLETIRAVRSADVAAADLDTLDAPLRQVLLRALDPEPRKRPFGPRELATQLRAAEPDAGRADLAAALGGLSPSLCGVPTTGR